MTEFKMFRVLLILIVVSLSIQDSCYEIKDCILCVKSQCVFLKSQSNTFVCVGPKYLFSFNPKAVYKTEKRCSSVNIPKSTTTTVSPDFVKKREESSLEKTIKPGNVHVNQDQLQQYKDRNTFQVFSHTPDAISVRLTTSDSNTPPLLKQTAQQMTIDFPNTRKGLDKVHTYVSTPKPTSGSPPTLSANRISKHPEEHAISDNSNTLQTVSSHTISFENRPTSTKSENVGKVTPTMISTKPTPLPDSNMLLNDSERHAADVGASLGRTTPTSLPTTTDNKMWTMETPQFGNVTVRPTAKLVDDVNAAVPTATLVYPTNSSNPIELPQSATTTAIISKEHIAVKDRQEIVKPKIIKSACRLEKLFREYGDIRYLDMHGIPDYKWVRFAIANPVTSNMSMCEPYFNQRQLI